MGAGDCDRGEGAADELLCGGPFAQADCEGSGVGVFPDVVETLLIEFSK